MAIGAHSFMSSRAVRKRVASPTLATSSRTHQLPGNQQLLRSQRAGAVTIQRKMRLSQENDPAERQADAVAEQIVSQESATGPIDAVPNQINRACPKCEEEIRRRADTEIEQPVGVTNEVPAVEEDAADVEDVVDEEEDSDEENETGMPKRDGSKVGSVSETVIPRGSGQAMSSDVLSRMESGFGTSFNQVRVHSDAASAKAASKVGALAFTIGNNVYFGGGQYSPDTKSGTRLLAHELTHVAQQQAGAGTLARKEGKKKMAEKKKGKGGSVCDAGNCPQGKQAKAVTGDCGTSGPVDTDKWIKHLEVSISDHTVIATWADGSKEKFPCSPRMGKTPTGPDTVGDKCGINHTNQRKKKDQKMVDGMAWFTAFDSTGHRIGFHDSQPVGSAFVSHGCVRVCCDVAKLINKNTWSGKTTINVS